MTRAPTLHYLVCATPRTGSSVICETLAATGVAGRPHEYLHDILIDGCCAEWGVARPETIVGYLRLLVHHTQTANGVFGMKVMHPKFSWLLQQMPSHELLSPEQVLSEEVLPGLRFIQVLRRDVLRQAVSHLRAKQTAHWSFHQAETQAPKTEPHYDFKALDKLVEKTYGFRAAWNQFFAGLPSQPIQVFYEDFAADWIGATRYLLDALGIEAPDPLFQRPVLLKRQSDAINEEWVQRYLTDKDQAGDEILHEEPPTLACTIRA